MSSRSVFPGTNVYGALLLVRYIIAELTSFPPTEIEVEGARGP